MFLGFPVWGPHCCPSKGEIPSAVLDDALDAETCESGQHALGVLVWLTKGPSKQMEKKHGDDNWGSCGGLCWGDPPPSSSDYTGA